MQNYIAKGGGINTLMVRGATVQGNYKISLLKIVYSFLTAALFWACTSNNNMNKLDILSRQPLAAVPSASGIEFVDGALYAMGDNSPWLFKLDSQYNVADKWLIFSEEGLVNGQIPKKEKPDFEAMTSIRYKNATALLIFGSGTKLKKRSGLIWATMGDSVTIEKYSLEDLYKSIIKKSGLGKEDLNIEAAVASSDKLYLFNRGLNTIIVYDLASFGAYIKEGGEMPKAEFFEIRLPEINNLVAGFSGASISPDSSQIIFTASVENTSNWIDDGEILGSFVGNLEIKNLENNIRPICALITENGADLAVKVESVAFKSYLPNGDMELLMTTDSDGGISEILRASTPALLPGEKGKINDENK